MRTRPQKLPMGARRSAGVPADARTSDGGPLLRVVRDDVVVRRGEPAAGTTERTHAVTLDRVVNVALATIAMIFLAPLFIAVAIAIKLTSRGPIFYMQPRVGVDRRTTGAAPGYDRRGRDLGGTIFSIYKFRTMFIDAETKTGAVWATEGDPRITPIGRFLRKCRIDELPQLINVIRGEMNIVGPRPERPSIFARLREDIAEYPLRQRAKPGITGWAQINQSYDSCLDDVRAKVRYDLEYLERQSIAEDLRIMVKTVPVMLFRKGGW
ncbi:MAG TPA: sugar transferase [Gemmatimonadaceae bacterium]|nr:sugar transferase [Gemmatimonadaceae bacterium]